MPACKTALAALAVAAGLSAPVSIACAQSLKELGRNGRTQAYPAVGRYVAAQGDSFVMERGAAHALLKYDDAPEVWFLTPHPGPRGDIIYRDDVGRAVVRATRLGGLILFTPERPAGTPVAFSTPTTTLRPRPITPAQLLRQLAQSSVRASRAARRTLPFEAPAVTPGSEHAVADAATVAAEGLLASAATPKGRSIIARLRRVRFVEGAAPAANVLRDTLEIVVAPARGAGGRPSSKRTALALELAAR